MTFLEAAIAILQREGKPLHFKKLTEIALRENLLDVVGRTPEATMQQRLNDAIRKDESTTPLVKDKPGTFGLRSYSPTAAPSGAPPPATPVAEAKVAAPASAAAVQPAVVAAPSAAEADDGEAASGPAAEGEGRRRRRRGSRGRGRKEETAPPAAVGDEVAERPPESPASPAVEELPPAAAPPEAVAPPPPAAPVQAAARVAPAPSGAPERMSFAEAQRAVAAAHSAADAGAAPAPRPVPAAPPVQTTPSAVVVAPAPRPPAPSPPVVAPPAASPAPPVAATAEDEALDELDLPSGPAVAPALGAEESVRADGHRPFEPRRESPRPHHRESPERREPERPAPPPAAPAPPAVAEVAAQEAAGRQLGPSGDFAEAAVDVLRNGDGKPAHVRQIVDLALKKKLLRGDPQELWRLVRIALVADQRSREAVGQRPRARPLGAGHFSVGDRRLDGELAQYEKDLADRATRLSEATRVALHRRIARLPPPSFEAFVRVLLDRQGFAAVELVKRGDSVTYLGGTRARGVQKLKALIAIRSGEGELRRRAVGELRAGLKARGFDEGVLFAAGRAGGEAITELQQPSIPDTGPLEIYDGDALSSLALRLGVGVVRRQVPIDTLDLELFQELTEA